MNTPSPPPGSDPIYKRLYTFARMVEDLLRSLFTTTELDADYGTLEKLSAEYVGDALQQRRGDTAWRLHTRGTDGSWLHVLVMLEFQTKTDSAMALRVLEYTALLYGELLRRGTKPGALPPVLPVVLYNGDSPWQPETEIRELIAPPPPVLAPYQPSQRHFVLDQRRAGGRFEAARIDVGSRAAGAEPFGEGPGANGAATGGTLGWRWQDRAKADVRALAVGAGPANGRQ